MATEDFLSKQAFQASITAINVALTNVQSAESALQPVLSNITELTQISSNIVSVVAVGENISSVQNVDGSIDAITRVDSNLGVISNVDDALGSVINVDAISGEVVSVDANSTNINTVAGNIALLDSVNANIAIYSNVDQSLDAISNVDAISSNIIAVDDNSDNINIVAGNIGVVNAVGSNIASVVNVDANQSNIDAVVGNIALLEEVSSNIDLFNFVESVASNINIVSGNINAINVVAENINAVINANVAGLEERLDEAESNISFLEISKVDKTSTNGSAVIPSGTEAERDAEPVAGLFRFNSDTGEFEGFNGTEWGEIGGAAGTGIVFGDTIEITVAEAGDTFALGELVSSGLVSVNGAWVKESDYSFSGTNIVFGYSLEVDDEILIKPVIENVSDVEGGGITFNNAIEVNATESGTTFNLGEVVTKALVSVNGAWVAPTEFSFSGEDIVFGFSLDEGDQILVYPVYQYINQTEVIDNLESTETGKALSANQGNLIKQLIDALDTDKVEKSGDTMSGLLRLTAGLNFNASGGSTLDEYEIGTFTPELTTSGDPMSFTYFSREGFYVRVGKIVFATAFFTLVSNATGGSGNIRLSAPFTCKDGGGISFLGSANVESSANTVVILSRISKGQSFVQVRKTDLNFLTVDDDIRAFGYGIQYIID